MSKDLFAGFLNNSFTAYHYSYFYLSVMAYFVAVAVRFHLSHCTSLANGLFL